jgi:DNA polymerase V
MYALVDCNNFYASCETVFNPGLRGQAVVVLSHNDGCVIARSAQAKAIGITMGMPGFQLSDQFPAIKIHQFSSNFTLYGSMSNRIHNILTAAVPAVENYSIDEAFLDLTGMKPADIKDRMLAIQSQIKEQVGIDVSIGVAPTKTLAKMANKEAKVRPGHMALVLDEGSILDLLKTTPITAVWGIGEQQARLCRAAGLHLAFDLRQAPTAWIRKNLSVLGARLQQELKGIACLAWHETPAPKKAIAIGRSFGSPQTDPIVLAEAAAAYADACARKLREQSAKAGSMQVSIQTNVHQHQAKQTQRSLLLQFATPQQDSLAIAAAARSAIARLYQPGFAYKKASIVLLDLVDAQTTQTDLFSPTPTVKRDQLMHAMDAINRLWGRQKIRPAAAGTGKAWQMRQQKMSPRYTTRIDEILVVNAKD